MTTKAAVLVPRRADGGHRDRLWTHVLDRWKAERLPVIEGHHHTGPFSRSAAINTAAATARDYLPGVQVYVIADSDTICPPAQVTAAIELAAADPSGMALGYEDWCGLDLRQTAAVLADPSIDPATLAPFRERYHRHTVSSLVAVTAQTFDLLDGFDERFVGWGWEDSSFGHTVAQLAGYESWHELPRVPGAVYHLRHPLAARTPEAMRLRRANRRRFADYQAASGDRGALLRLAHGGDL